MASYNLINGDYASGNEPILNDVVKQAWGYKGWVMSDWKAIYSWDYANKGLDMHSGMQLDEQEWFGEPLKEAYQDGKFTKERLSCQPRNEKSGNLRNEKSTFQRAKSPV